MIKANSQIQTQKHAKDKNKQIVYIASVAMSSEQQPQQQEAYEMKINEKINTRFYEARQF